MIWELKEIAEGIHDTKMLERDDRFRRFLEKGKEFKKYFEPNVIYVRLETANKIRTTYISLEDSALKWNEALNTTSDDSRLPRIDGQRIGADNKSSSP